jgi:hypothetical protein
MVNEADLRTLSGPRSSLTGCISIAQSVQIAYPDGANYARTTWCQHFIYA